MSSPGVGGAWPPNACGDNDPDESLFRAAVRTAAYRATSGAVAGAVAVGIDGAYDAIARTAPGTVNAPTVVAIGAGASAPSTWPVVTDCSTPPPRPTSTAIPCAPPATSSRCARHGGRRRVSLGPYASSRVESLVATGIAAGIRWAIPPLAPAAGRSGTPLPLGGVAFALERAISILERHGGDGGKRDRTRLPLPTGFRAGQRRPQQRVDWNTIGREGAASSAWH